MGLVFARAGYLVVNISYRLAPRHPFPAALEDCVDALAWIARHARDYGGDPERLVFAGESAGANLACALAITTCYRRPEPYAQRAWDTGLVPAAALLGCGILQVSDPQRFARRRRFPRWVQRMITDISDLYIPVDHPQTELVDPLLVLERGEPPARPLPGFFAFVGTRDPVLDDTRRLDRALAKLGVAREVRFYPGELHAFHALMMRKAARQCWRDKLAFLDRTLNAARAAVP
jgi:acetyl esterase